MADDPMLWGVSLRATPKGVNFSLDAGWGLAEALVRLPMQIFELGKIVREEDEKLKGIGQETITQFLERELPSSPMTEAGNVLRDAKSLLEGVRATVRLLNTALEEQSRRTVEIMNAAEAARRAASPSGGGTDEPAAEPGPGEA